MTEVQSAGISRRRIVQGAAWATPAVLIATAAPAAASSTVVELTATAGPSGTLTIDYDKPSNAVLTVTLTWNASELSQIASASGATVTTSGGNTAVLTIPAGATGSVVIVWTSVKKTPAVVSGSVTSNPVYSIAPSNFSRTVGY